MVGGTIPNERHLRGRERLAQPVQHLKGIVAIGTVKGQNLDFTEVIEVETLEGDFGLAGSIGTHPKSLSFNRPTVAFIGIEVNMGLINVEQ